MALRPGQDARTLRNGEFYGFGVDTGTGCFVDAAAAARLTGGEDIVPDADSTDGIHSVDDLESGATSSSIRAAWGRLLSRVDRP
jgi:hypothetical protein